MSCIFLCFFYFPSFSEYHFGGVPALNEKLKKVLLNVQI